MAHESNDIPSQSLSKTPERNKIQNMFLSNEHLETFISHICEKEKFRYLKSLLLQNNFEKETELEGIFNWDVIIGKGGLCYTKWKGNCSCDENKVECKKSCYDGDNETYDLFSIFVEIKPLVGDDYPAILRKMKTQIELTKTDLKKRFNEELEHHENDPKFTRWRQRNPGMYTGRFYLLVKDYQSSTTSKEEFVKIFDNSGITVLFLSDVFGIIEDISERNIERNIEYISSVSNKYRFEIMESYIKQLEERVSKLELLMCSKK